MLHFPYEIVNDQSTGGFGASRDMLKRYAPGTERFPTTNGHWATGDGLKLGEDVGANLVQPEQVQIHPTGFVNPADRDSLTKFLAPEALRGSGGILLNKEGQRFVDELSTRDRVVEAILQQSGQGAFLLLSKAATDKFGAAVRFYAAKKMAKECNSYADVAEFVGTLPQSIQEAVEAYNRVTAGEVEDSFGKTVFPTTFGPVDEAFPAFVMEIVPVVHYCMGGLLVDLPVDGL